jgi:peptide/nickel transport system substrate-binding protein
VGKANLPALEEYRGCVEIKGGIILKRLSILCLTLVIAFASTALAFAAQPSPLADPRVRQAIAYAIDMEALIDSLMEGRASVANSLTPDGEWKVDGLNPYEYNPEKAKQLLKEAGWDPNTVLDVVYYYGDQETVDLMAAIQVYLDQVGIKMNARKLEGDLAAQLWMPPADPVNGPSAVDWDLAYGAVAALAMHEYYNRFMGGAASNSHTPTDPVLDELIKATNVADIEAQKQAFFELQKYENETLFNIPLYHQQQFVVESNRLDRKGAPIGNQQFFSDWRIIDWDVQPDAKGNYTLYSSGGPIEFFETVFTNPALYMTQKFLFDRLVVADENLTPYKGQLASEYSVSEDGLTIEFVLRDGITWHDGTPITAEDVKFTVEYSARVPQLNAVAAATYSSLEGYDAFMNGEADGISGIVIDGNKITFNFATVDPNALLTFSQWPPLPKHLLKDTDPVQAQRAAYWQAPVGSGPFKIEEVQMNSYSTYVRWEGYWDEGTGNIERVQLYPSGESDPSFVINAQSGLIDFGFTKNVAESIAVEKMDHMTVHPINIRYTRLFYPNKFPR